MASMILEKSANVSREFCRLRQGKERRMGVGRKDKGGSQPHRPVRDCRLLGRRRESHLIQISALFCMDAARVSQSLNLLLVLAFLPRTFYG
jgi:hypothetical protein